MNILDKNGKLFGKINIIDFSVIMILLLAVPLFIFAYQAMNSKKNEPTKWVTVELKIQRVDPELIEALKEGDVEKNELGKKIGIFGKLSKVTSTSTAVLVGDTMVNDSLKKDITVTVRLLCKDYDNNLYYKNFPVKIGSIITFSTITYEITGVAIKVDRS